MDHKSRFEALLNDDSRYRLLVDGITDYAIYMLDPTGLVASWNAGAQRFKGYSADEIIGKHFSTFYRPQEREAGVPERALQTAAAEGRFEHEGWRLRKDGTAFWAHAVIDAIRGPNGDLIGFAKITRDLTERRAAEKALRDSERQFRLLVQGVTDYAIFMLDPEGNITNWNPGAERIKGYKADEVVGTHFSRFYPKEDRERGLPQRNLATAARVGRWEQEGRRVRKDGTTFWAHVIIDAIRNETGQLIGFAKVTRDITERVEAQRALDQTREALFQSQKLDAIGQLTGGVAHDFNNLLAAILGSLELVRKRLPPDPRVTPLIDNAIEGALRGSSLTQRMLAFARKQELKLEAVDLCRLAPGLIAFLERAIGPSITIETRLPAHLPRMRTDPAQLENALLNLTLNARDAMPKGGRILISAEEVDVTEPDGLAPGPYVRLAVSDTGEGMDAETLARASEPFFTTKGVGKGTGLGLSMVHGLALQSGGKLDLASTPGEGTTVSIYLAVTSEDASEGQELKQAAEPQSRNLTVLAVDDDTLVLNNTAALLEDAGHEVLKAESGEEAVKILAGRPDVDVVVTDHAMPQMTGLQLRDWVLADRRQVPVILATGFAEMPEDAPLDAIRLAKPFSQAQLLAAIHAATDLAD